MRCIGRRYGDYIQPPFDGGAIHWPYRSAQIIDAIRDEYTAWIARKNEQQQSSLRR